MELAEEMYPSIYQVDHALTKPDIVDNSGKIMAAVAYFGMACVMDSDVLKEAEDFWQKNNKLEENM